MVDVAMVRGGMVDVAMVRRPTTLLAHPRRWRRQLRASCRWASLQFAGSCYCPNLAPPHAMLHRCTSL
jgi:hypothetical protein